MNGVDINTPKIVSPVTFVLMSSRQTIAKSKVSKGSIPANSSSQCEQFLPPSSC